jgi:hypothetical protein
MSKRLELSGAREAHHRQSQRTRRFDRKSMTYFVIHITPVFDAAHYALVDLLITITSRTSLYCKYLISHSTDSLKAPSFAAFTVALLCTRVYELWDTPVKIHEHAPDHRERQIHGMHPHSKSGGTRARSLQMSYLLFQQRTLGTTRRARSY